MASRSAMMDDDGYPSSSAAPAFDSQHEWEEHRRATIDDDRDELDLLGEDGDDNNRRGNDDMILDDDPLRDDLNQPMSFKRKQKQSVFSQTSRLFSAFTGGRSPRNSHDVPGGSSPTSNTRLDSTQSGSKDGGPMDWYVEGPGRRVGYEDLTAIDWIFEYTKERQRLRMLSSGSNSLVGWIRLLLDNSQVWIVLLLTGLAAGLLAAAIDVATDWLADLKFGFCSTIDGGAFHLSKSSCCLGYEDHAQCQGWYPWARAFGIHSGGGKWFIEYFFYVFLALSFAVSAAILVKEYAIYAKHSGIPEIKTVLGGFVIRKFLGIQTLVTKSLGLVLAVASGMWLGKEGPLVHVACCCANVFIKLFPSINNNEARKREILSAAAASGISVAFGSPIGGVLFSLEQLSYYFPDKTMWQSFVCAMTAAVTLQALDPFRSGKLVLYQVKYSSGWHGFELVPFVLLGIAGGIYGGLFIKANMRVAEWKKSSRWMPGPVTQVAIVAGLTTLINYPNYYMRAQTSELVSNLFTECAKMVDDQFGLCKTGAASFGTIALLIFAAVLGFFFAAVTFGLQIPAGIILPSMAIGALSGRALGILMELFQRAAPNFPLFLHQCEPDIPCITPGTYAIIGAAAFLAGVTRMTVSIVVITFELTGALTYVLPIMISVMISKWVGDAFARRGIYESWIHFNSYPYLDPNNSGEDLSPLIPDVPASQIMTRLDSDLIVLTATGHTIASLTKILETTPYRGFPVISDPRSAILLGYISRAELSFILLSPGGRAANLPPETECFFSHQPLADPLTTLDLRPWMDQTPLTLPGRSPLHLAVSYFQKLGVRYVLFAERGVLQGLLTRKDVWHVMNGAEERVRDDVGVGNVGGIGSGGGRMDASGKGREEGRGESAGLLGVDARDYFVGQGGGREGRSGIFAGSQGSIL